jgi:hypothetical protein
MDRVADHVGGALLAFLERPLGIVASALVFPRQLIKRRLVAMGAVAIFWNVEFLALVVFDPSTMLIAPAVSFSINSARFHKPRISTVLKAARVQTETLPARDGSSLPGTSVAATRDFRSWRHKRTSLIWRCWTHCRSLA